MKTFVFKGNLQAKPGQFVMLWIPGVDQKPFGISKQAKNEFEVSVMLRGKFTKAMFKMKTGDKVGIQGPYGTSFSLVKNKKVIVVGGGCGMAPLGFLIDELKKNKNKVIIVNSARTKNNLLYADRFKDSQFCTDDGSKGHHGYATTVLEEELKKGNIAKIYSCGAEVMMKAIAQVANKHQVACELSLERYMKCGFGVCGQCVIDPLGIRMCKEGPVLSSKLVKRLGEFGNYHRDKSGKKVKF